MNIKATAAGLPILPADSHESDRDDSPGKAPHTQTAAWAASVRSMARPTAVSASNRSCSIAFRGDDACSAGQIGDLIQPGSNDRRRHVGIIANVALDAQSNALDSLISSNAADPRVVLVSACPHPQQRLIRIHGRNGGTQS